MKNVIGGTCGMHVDEQFYWSNFNEGDSWEDLGLDGRIVMLKEQCVECNHVIRMTRYEVL
jgi:hypothetical protein